MNEIELLQEKILRKYPEVETELILFRRGMYWLEVWFVVAGSRLRECWVIVEWDNPNHEGFGFADMSDPENDRHVFELRMDEIQLDSYTVFERVCAILDRKK